jgi:protein-disulfide isomerase
MRRSILISTLLAATIAVLGACDPKTEVPNKPVASPTPAATASPVASPSVSPAKTGDVKKDEVKTTDGKNVNGNVNKEVKPAETPKAK